MTQNLCRLDDLQLIEVMENGILDVNNLFMA